MKLLQRKTKKVISVSLLLILSISSILMLFPLNPTVSENFNNNKDDGESEGLIPLVSQVGEDPWWNGSYQWRQCINITNPGSYDLIDNIIKIQFNWKNLNDSGHLQDDLDDIRIVENGALRNYYIKQDFPSSDLATVWFETNSTAGSKQYDTYMYYGNDSVSQAENYYMAKCPDGIARWEFEEGSGNMAYDSISDKYHGTLINMESADFVATPELEGNYALTFDGANEYIALNMSMNYVGGHLGYQSTTLLGSIEQFTATAWVKIQEDRGGWSILDFDRSEYFTFAAGTPGYRADDGHVEFDCTNDYGQTDDYHGGILIDEDGAWHHCVITFDYTQEYDKKIFVDGVLDLPSRNSWSGNPYPIGDISETRFGYIGDGSESTSFNGGRNNHYFEGLLDDVRYFDYALSDKEIEWLANHYPLEIDLLGEVERAAKVTIIIKDIDDRTVSGAEVSLWKNSTHLLNVGGTDYTQFTLSDGSVAFSQVPFAFYNITVNYTTYSGLYEKVVYDSRDEIDGEVEFKGLYVSINITADLWTIYFEVEDWDGDPLNYGKVEVGNSTIDVIDTLPLDSNGEATFRWINYTSYNYTVYYDNPDYTPYPTRLNQSTVTYTVKKKYEENVTTTMAKLDIRVMDSSGTNSVTGVKIKAQINGTGQGVVDLVTDTTGYAFGQYTKDFGFWYKTEQVYNFTLWIIDLQQSFEVNVSDKWKPTSFTWEYNYTLDGAAYLEFLLDLDFTARIANFTNDQGEGSVTWGENMTFSLTYETSNNSGVTWFPDWDRYGFSTEATWTIYTKYGEELLALPMNQGSTNGSFTITVNSNLFSARDISEYYYILVSGYKPFWNDPGDAFFGITIYAKSTGMTLHNYTSMPDELPKNAGGDYEISEYYGFTISITARYFDSETSSALPAESFTFDWDYGSG
ncbi:MAG: LamG domain-containing protein, partial [Promethearchaeota archaeon]